MKRHSALSRAGGLLAATLMLGACASNMAVPTASLATARTAIAEAEAVGAMQGAPTELIAARENLYLAQMAVREEDYERARQFAQRAEADAMLAERKTRAAKAQRAAQELARTNELFRHEAARGATR